MRFTGAMLLLMFCMLTPRPAEARTLPRIQELHAAVLAKGPLISEIQKFGQDDQRQMLCMALNIYHEIRSGSPRDQWAVGFVTINRTRHLAFHAKDVCSVVWAPNQFSWTRWPVRAQLPSNQAQWEECQKKAALLIAGEKINDPTRGSTHFNSSLRGWGRGLVGKFRLGPHWFARLPGIQ